MGPTRTTDSSFYMDVSREAGCKRPTMLEGPPGRQLRRLVSPVRVVQFWAGVGRCFAEFGQIWHRFQQMRATARIGRKMAALAPVNPLAGTDARPAAGRSMHANASARRRGSPRALQVAPAAEKPLRRLDGRPPIAGERARACTSPCARSASPRPCAARRSTSAPPTAFAPHDWLQNMQCDEGDKRCNWTGARRGFGGTSDVAGVVANLTEARSSAPDLVVVGRSMRARERRPPGRTRAFLGLDSYNCGSESTAL